MNTTHFALFSHCLRTSIVKVQKIFPKEQHPQSSASWTSWKGLFDPDQGGVFV